MTWRAISDRPCPKTVFTSDGALKLDWIPPWVAIIGSGYIGLEFSDVYTALGSEVTFIEAMPKVCPGFDAEIGKQAERILIAPRNIDYVTNVLATKAGSDGTVHPCSPRRPPHCKPSIDDLYVIR